MRSYLSSKGIFFFNFENSFISSSFTKLPVTAMPVSAAPVTQQPATAQNNRHEKRRHGDPLGPIKDLTDIAGLLTHTTGLRRHTHMHTSRGFL